MTRLLALLAVTALAACATTPKETDAGEGTLPGYEAVEDGGFQIEAVKMSDLAHGHERREVEYTGSEKAGTIVVDTFARRLYHVQEGGKAMSYSIAVGREGLAFRGSGVIGRKEKWPSWQPTANMVRTRPDLYSKYAGGLEGGLENPLGARAMYLYRGGRDSMFRIHGTIDNSTIGRATSAGCIRLFNQDAIYLYDQVESGTPVKVRSEAESLEAEGKFMEDAWGVAVPETPENIAKKELDVVKRAEQEARLAEEAAKEAELAAKAAAKADKKRLAACKRKGIAPEDCPALPEVADADAVVADAAAVATAATTDAATQE